MLAGRVSKERLQPVCVGPHFLNPDVAGPALARLPVSRTRLPAHLVVLSSNLVSIADTAAAATLALAIAWHARSCHACFCRACFDVGSAALGHFH
jgi:hypothetical protein